VTSKISHEATFSPLSEKHPEVEEHKRVKVEQSDENVSVKVDIKTDKTGMTSNAAVRMEIGGHKTGGVKMKIIEGGGGDEPPLENTLFAPIDRSFDRFQPKFDPVSPSDSSDASNNDSTLRSKKRAEPEATIDSFDTSNDWPMLAPKKKKKKKKKGRPPKDAKFKRPSGGAPKGCEWDYYKGGWVDVNTGDTIETATAALKMTTEEVPVGDPRREMYGYTIPSSWTVTRERGKKNVFSCTNTTLGVGPLTRQEAFEYMARERPDEVYTIVIPPGDSNHMFRKYRKKKTTLTLTAAWTVKTTASYKNGYTHGVLYKNDALGVSFTTKPKCWEYIQVNQPSVWKEMLAAKEKG